MKTDKRFSSPVQSFSNKTLKTQQRFVNSAFSKYRSINPHRRSSAISYEIGTIKEHPCVLPKFDSSRRMSAPEFPPILDSQKYTNYSNMGNGNQEYLYNRNGSNGRSNNSDSSQKGVRFGRSPHSASSSSSRQTPANSGMPRSKTWMTPEQTPTTILEGIKLDSINNRNGITVPTPRTIRRFSSKDRDNSTCSGNNNTRPGKSKFHHSASEPKIQPIDSYMGSRGRTSMKRNSSDNKLLQNKKLISIEKTQNLTQSRYNSGNVNGMRRYSSTFQLNNGSKNKSETDDCDNDDDTDSESGKDQMIIEWLIGVEDREIPPEPCIDYDDTPSQTDTAIHIVYSDS